MPSSIAAAEQAGIFKADAVPHAIFGALQVLMQLDQVIVRKLFDPDVTETSLIDQELHGSAPAPLKVPDHAAV